MQKTYGDILRLGNLASRQYQYTDIWPHENFIIGEYNLMKISPQDIYSRGYFTSRKYQCAVIMICGNLVSQ